MFTNTDAHAHTRTHLLRTVIANSVVECILRAKTLQLHPTGMGQRSDPKRNQRAAIVIASVVAKLKLFEKIQIIDMPVLGLAGRHSRRLEEH